MIEITNLKFGYKKNKTVLEDINLQIQEGRIFGLLGKNGVGKSTLLHLIAGLQFPTQGTIRLDGRNPQKRLVSTLQELFLLGEEVPQTSLSIEKFKQMNAKFYPNFKNEDFMNYLSEFEIKDMNERIDKLSFGTRKKVFIAFALACNTKYLFMDEPTNGLDIPSKASLRKILRLAMTDKRCVIISTHQARDLQNILDAIALLDDTKVLIAMTNEQITEKLYFGAESESDDKNGILYIEPSVTGNQIVRLNKGGEESNLDVELLFNAVFSNKDLFKKTFNL